MAIYNGTQKINMSGIDKVYVGSQLVYQKQLPPSWHTLWDIAEQPYYDEIGSSGLGGDFSNVKVIRAAGINAAKTERTWNYFNKVTSKIVSVTPTLTNWNPNSNIYKISGYVYINKYSTTEGSGTFYYRDADNKLVSQKVPSSSNYKSFEIPNIELSCTPGSAYDYWLMEAYVTFRAHSSDDYLYIDTNGNLIVATSPSATYDGYAETFFAITKIEQYY